MAQNKKLFFRILIGAIIVVVIAIIVYLFRCSIFKNLSSCVQDPNKNNTPLPKNSPTSKWVPESFPLNTSMFGPKIKALQAALGFKSLTVATKLDGYLGDYTKAAIIAAGYTLPLSQADYDKILGVKTPVSGDVGKSARSKSDLTAVYINDSATNPSFLRYIPKDQEAGIVQSSDATWYYLQGSNTKVKKAEVYLLG